MSGPQFPDAFRESFDVVVGPDGTPLTITGSHVDTEWVDDDGRTWRQQTVDGVASEPVEVVGSPLAALARGFGLAPPTDWWFWLSFADADRPEGDQFLGACIVRGESIVEAVSRAHELGINPGGEVLGTGPIEGAAIPENQPREVLMSTADLDAAGITFGRIDELDE